MTLEQRLAKVVKAMGADSRLALEVFLMAHEQNSPAELTLHSNRKGTVDGEVRTGPTV